MSKPCPIYGKAISADCVDCDDKICRKKKRYKHICIGIDQSYKCTGVSISADGKLLKVKSIKLDKYKTNSEKRKVLKCKLKELCKSVLYGSENVHCVIERIRLRSKGFINIDYIKSIGALNSVIIDVMSDYNIPVESVDTRAWKAQVVGTSKPKDNKFGVPSEKWPTVQWVIKQGFESSILNEVKGRREKGTFIKDETKYEYNNDAADSAAISMFYFMGNKSQLKIEK